MGQNSWWIFCSQFFLVTVIFLLVPAQGNPTADEKGKLFEGDISMSKEEKNLMRKEIKLYGTVENPYGWKNGIVPFIISEGFNDADRTAIQEAMNEISESTCIRFQPRTVEKDYILFIVSDKCSSKVGRSGGMQGILIYQHIKMKSLCMRHGTIVHELIHSLGFWHEQSRTDRDKYITIWWKNINPKSKVNFEKYTDGYSNEFRLPYDYGSIMHYSGDAFQKERGLQTIVPKTKDAPIGLRTAMSHFDKLKINLMYECKDYLN